jgi:gamma-glutamyltranspeptidase/glutathione hydrolase
MSQHLAQNWNARKPVARSRSGIIATQNRIAGEAGGRILAAGGNAVDAAFATGCAFAAVELLMWQQALATQAELLWRAKKNRVLHCEKRLADGSYLSSTRPKNIGSGAPVA